MSEDLFLKYLRKDLKPYVKEGDCCTGIVELRREIEDLTNSNNFWKRKCSEMGIALKTYEEGRYQEHLENEQLHSIIKEAREKIITTLTINSDYVDYDFGTELLRHELLEILDKVEENK